MVVLFSQLLLVRYSITHFLVSRVKFCIQQCTAKLAQARPRQFVLYGWIQFSYSGGTFGLFTQLCDSFENDNLYLCCVKLFSFQFCAFRFKALVTTDLTFKSL